MIKVPFVKYTSYGNNFVIVDETEGGVLSELQKANFAFQATNTHFGIGCDNLLVLQRCHPSILNEINRQHGYWQTPPDSGSADFIFRMFEPNGDEAFSCGNGLISIADFLRHRFALQQARIMTEIPLTQPKVLTLRSDGRQGTSTVNLGKPRRVPDTVASRMIREPVDECIDRIGKIQIRFRANDLKDYTSSGELTMSGHMVFTGEPHLVIFPEESFSDQELVSPMFSGIGDRDSGSIIRRRVSIGTWLVRRIGTFLNDQFRGYFPAGININFARIDSDHNTVEYRCFERGIYRETLACGTGAIAVAVVAKHLGKVSGNSISVLPHLCRMHDEQARMHAVTEADGQWCLSGTPRLLVDGHFMLQEELPSSTRSTDLGDTLQMLALESQLSMRPRFANAG